MVGRSLLLLQLAILSLAASARAELARHEGLPDRHLTVQAETIPSRDLSSGANGGSYGEKSLDVEGRFPLWLDEDLQMAILPRIGRERLSPTPLGRTVGVTRLGTGFAASILAENGETYSLTTSLDLRQESLQLSDLDLQWTLLATGTAALSERFSLLFGLTNSYAFGAAAMFPVAGFRWEPGDAWVVRLLLPLSFEARREVSRKVALRAFAQMDGERWRLRDSVTARKIAMQLGAGAELLAGERWLLGLDLGVVAARRLAFARDTARFADDTLRRGAFAELTATWAW